MGKGQHQTSRNHDGQKEINCDWQVQKKISVLHSLLAHN